MKIVKGIAVLEEDQYICKWVQESGRLDHDQNLLPRILPYVKGTVIDVGAFIGDHTIAYARRANKVIAFEPNPNAYQCLDFNLKNYPNVELRNQGLGEIPGKISLTDVPTNVGMVYASKSNKGIDCITIDSLNLDRLDFIKIDAEGYEHNILKGAEETIKKYKPVMVLEINNHALMRNRTSNNDVYIYLMKLGYDYRNVYPSGGLHDEQLDILCTPKK